MPHRATAAADAFDRLLGAGKADCSAGDTIGNL
jgi:hypothetical protein